MGGRTSGSALRGPKGWSAAGRTGASEPFKPGRAPRRDSGVRPSPLRPPPENPLWRACLFLPPPTSQRRLMRQRAGGISPKMLLLPGASGDIFNFVWFLLFPRITVAGADGGGSGRVDGEGGARFALGFSDSRPPSSARQSGCWREAPAVNFSCVAGISGSHSFSVRLVPALFPDVRQGQVHCRRSPNAFAYSTNTCRGPTMCQALSRASGTRQ